MPSRNEKGKNRNTFSLTPSGQNSIKLETRLRVLTSDRYINLLHEVYDYLSRSKVSDYLTGFSTFTMGTGITGIINWITANKNQKFTFAKAIDETKFFVYCLIAGCLLFCGILIYRHFSFTHNKNKFTEKFENYAGIESVFHNESLTYGETNNSEIDEQKQ